MVGPHERLTTRLPPSLTTFAPGSTAPERRAGDLWNVKGHLRDLTADSRITTRTTPLGFYSGLCPPPCLSSFNASTRLARHAGSPLATRVTTPRRRLATSP
jgi:hypothetical protein